MTRKIAVIGLGYVGLPLAIRAAEKGYQVVGIDIDKRKINLLNKGIPPIGNGEFEKKLKKNAPSLNFTNHYSGIEETSNIIICVPTPVNGDRTPNLEPLKKACLGISRYLAKGQLVILESTVNPGVSEGIILPILEDGSKLKAGEDFYLSHCPERINPGNEVKELQHLYKIPRVVGGLEKKSLRKTVAFYRSIINASIKPMGSLQEAESVKMVENIFRDINIALVNELAMSFDKLGIDVVNVINGAATKPFSFMPHYPGVGVGGHCIPVDPYYLIDYAKTNGFHHRFLELGREINSSMPKFTVELLKSALGEAHLDIDGAKIAVRMLTMIARVRPLM
ncbi:MAG: nucleotide sugar dehydrogenase [Candidatus Colwellbacteria bacterium]|nr:nucleotide sugar dehydrogenase [Candidatus Colwellbacteria bacterium]